MNILLTGSNGFLAKNIENQISGNFDITKTSRNNSDYNCDLVNNIPQFKKKFELVIHTAGKAHCIPKNEFEKKIFFDTNLIGTSNLLNGLLISGLPKYFVFISSVSVYGLNEGLLVNENFPLLAQDPYGKSKIETENLIKTWCENYNVKYTILRLPLVIGNGAPGNLKSLIKGISQGYYFNIGGGIARKSMVLANDVAKFILPAAFKGGIYNLTDGIHPTFYELSSKIAEDFGKPKLFNLPLFTGKILSKIGDLCGSNFPFNSDKLTKITSTLTFDDSNARVAFGWEPTSVLQGFKFLEDV